MSRWFRTALLLMGTACLVLSSATVAQAQFARGMRLFGPIHAATLAQLPEVQQAINLTDAQKTQVTELNQQLSDKRRELFQNAAGDFDRMREEGTKLNAEFAVRFNAALQPPQQARMQEINLQVNGPVVLLYDESVGKALNVSAEQRQQLTDAADTNRAEAFAAFQDFQNLSDDERAKKVDGLLQNRDKSFLAVLTEAQRGEFEKMKGTKLEVNLDNLPRPGL
jgi:hypothetical protein